MQPLDIIRSSSYYATTTSARIVDAFHAKRGGWHLTGCSPSGEPFEPVAVTAAEVRRLKREGVTSLHLYLFDADGDRIARADFPPDDLRAGIDPHERREEETRDQHIRRLLNLWEAQREATPNGKAQKATWAALIEAAYDESEIVWEQHTERDGIGSRVVYYLRPVGTYVAWRECCMGPNDYDVLGRVKRHAKSRTHGCRWYEVTQKYRKAGSWTQGR